MFVRGYLCIHQTVTKLAASWQFSCTRIRNFLSNPAPSARAPRYDARMEKILCDISALEFWRGASEAEARRVLSHVRGAGSAQAQALDSNALHDLGVTLPAHLLMKEEVHDAAFPHKVRICQSGLPPHSILRISGDLCVTCPELTYVQLGTVLEPAELLQVGYELCGFYLVSSQGMQQTSAPLTSVQKIGSYIEACPPIRGIKPARAMLKFVREPSGSLRETKLVLVLCLPKRRGGYGLPWPVLNHRIELTPYLRKVTGRSYLCADLCWPEYMLVIEYDSDEWHEDDAARTRDAQKRMALEALGFTVITVTTQQLNNPDMTDAIAHEAARRLGERMRGATPTVLAKRHELREALGLPK